MFFFSTSECFGSRANNEICKNFITSEMFEFHSTYYLLIFYKIRGFYIPSPSKAEAGHLGVIVHENAGADSWETCSD